MNVDFEFLSEQPIENVITCLNFRFDKVVFFGYTDTVRKMKKQTRDFLTGHCGVSEVLFFQMKQHDLQQVTEGIRERVREERSAGNKVFFDTTGGEPLLLLAFGIMSREMKVPVHSYEVKEKAKLHLLESTSGESVREIVPEQKIRLDLDMFIRMYGASIEPRRKRKDFPTVDIREIEDETFRQMIPRIWNMWKKYAGVWTDFSDFLKKAHQYGAGLRYEMTTQQALGIIRTIQATHGGFTPKIAKAMLEEFHKAGVLGEYRWNENKQKLLFAYSSLAVKKCLSDSGSILELYVGQQELEHSDDCRVGVRIDWDGDPHDNPEYDVENEIDVLTLKGYSLCFISCKIGNVSKVALYELFTVANRFGGDYSKKRLVAQKGVTRAEQLRAEELGIEVVRM
ncbi:MAG: hypothetical protein IJP92_00125 [Lachnospiraceae bacterium]|nr:hypothetical protein [Lachnospiraceae bacterium]